MKLSAQWRKVPLRDVANVQTGLSKSQNRTGPSVLRPYLRVANVQDGHFDLTEIKTIEVPATQVERFSLRNGDVLLTEGGDFDKLGRGSIWNGDIPNCVHQNHVFAVRVIDSTVLLPEFLACEIQSIRAKNYFLSCAKQTTNLASINSSQLKELPILVPPLSEQRVIVNTNAAWDTAIQKNEQLITAKSLYLSRFRDQLLRKPKRASTTKLSNVTKELTARNGKILGREAVMAITKSVGMRPMREETIAGNIERYKLVPPQGFAYNPMRLNIGSIAKSPFDHDVLVSPDYVVFACDESKLLPSYLHHLRHSQKWVSHFELAGNGGVRVRIYYDDLGRFTFALPPIDVQARLVQLLDAASQEIAVLTRYADALRAQKRGLMQKLLTGQWRLPIPKQAQEIASV
ncbi:restriction endonuclease subunit S [Nevskia sp.]|uniref:restriction endonuclease subunit S n=1 Tax=Nevskia sp. TaxID=1929292 RepID=UPI0025F97E5B|nr:restriction endonuclease subunit S [Nevskia sp.]